MHIEQHIIVQTDKQHELFIILKQIVNVSAEWDV